MAMTITTITTLEKEGKKITLTETTTLDTNLDEQVFRDYLNAACREFIQKKGSQHEEETTPPA